MTNESERTPWWQNPNIQSALITGFLGLVGTIVTVRATRPPAPTPTPIHSITEIDHSAQQQVSSPTTIPPVAPYQPIPQPEVNLRLNFAEYQKRLAKAGVTKEEAARYFDPIQGHAVVWEGYLDQVIIHDPPLEGGVYCTVSIVENSAKVTQSMFKTPALFRMPASELATARTLRKGDLIKVMGKLQNYSLIATVITEGHLLEPSSSAGTNVARGKSTQTQQ